MEPIYSGKPVLSGHSPWVTAKKRLDWIKRIIFSADNKEVKCVTSPPSELTAEFSSGLMTAGNIENQIMFYTTSSAQITRGKIVWWSPQNIKQSIKSLIKLNFAAVLFYLVNSLCSFSYKFIHQGGWVIISFN